MARFSIKQFGDNLVDYAAKRANKAMDKSETQILQYMRDCMASVESMSRWINRTYNLVSSAYAVLLYNGKILGVETVGARLSGKAKTSSRSKAKDTAATKKKVGMRKTGVNPVFSYLFTSQGHGLVAWQGDSQDPKRVGRVFANIAVEEAIKGASNVGYAICIGFAMPYAASPKGRPPMKVRTTAVLEELIQQLADNIRGLGIETSFKKSLSVSEYN